MSFTGTVKDEVTHLEGNKLEYISELSCIGHMQSFFLVVDF